MSRTNLSIYFAQKISQKARSKARKKIGAKVLKENLKLKFGQPSILTTALTRLFVGNVKFLIVLCEACIRYFISITFFVK